MISNRLTKEEELRNAALLRRYMRPVNQIFFIPVAEDDDTRERNVFGYWKGFGKAATQYYETQDAREQCNEQAIGQVL